MGGGACMQTSHAHVDMLPCRGRGLPVPRGLTQIKWSLEDFFPLLDPPGVSVCSYILPLALL